MNTQIDLQRTALIAVIQWGKGKACPLCGRRRILLETYLSAECIHRLTENAPDGALAHRIVDELAGRQAHNGPRLYASLPLCLHSVNPARAIRHRKQQDCLYALFTEEGGKRRASGWTAITAHTSLFTPVQFALVEGAGRTALDCLDAHLLNADAA